MRVDLHPAAIRALRATPQVRARLMEVGEVVAERAKAAAPKDSPSKGGAASIHAEMRGTVRTPEVHVSWDPAHFYMRFNEEGTEHQPARPFLRPAAESIR